MLKKTCKFAVARSKNTKKVIKAAAWGAQKVLSQARKFKVPDELSMTNIEMLIGIWDKSVSTILKKVLKPGSTFVDVGAHVGYFTKEAAKIVGEEGKVFAFEANIENFAMLTANTEKFSQVTPIQAAVSNVEGIVRFYNSPIGSGRHSTVSERNEESVPTDVKAVTLDQALGDTQVDLIKIDVEGAELAVLQGMHGIIERSSNLHMILEFFPELFAKQGIPPHTLLQTLKDEGFRIYHLQDHKHYFPITDAQAFTATLKEKYINIYAVKD